MKNYKPLLWKVCKWLALVVMVLVFSDFVIPTDKFEPKLMGMPYTLWVGILVSCLLVFLTFLATKLHPERKNNDS